MSLNYIKNSDIQISANDSVFLQELENFQREEDFFSSSRIIPFNISILFSDIIDFSIRENSQADVAEKPLIERKFSYRLSDSKEEEQQVYDLTNNTSFNRALRNVLSMVNITSTIGDVFSIDHFKSILEDLLDQNSAAFREEQLAMEELNADSFLQEVGDYTGNSIGPVDANGAANMAGIFSGLLGIALSLAQKVVTQIAISTIPKEGPNLPVLRDIKILKYSSIKKENQNKPQEERVWSAIA